MKRSGTYVMEKMQWWLHELADKITIFAPVGYRKMAFYIANFVDNVAMWIGRVSS